MSSEDQEEILDDSEVSSQENINILAITDRDNILSLIRETDQRFDFLNFLTISHDDDYLVRIDQADIVFIECRIVGIFADLQTIRNIRKKSPMIPIVVISENQDSEFVLIAFNEGISDYVSVKITKEILAAKFKAFYKYAQSARFVEIQNEHLVSTMKSLRIANDDLKQEATNRIIAEAEMDMAEEVAKAHAQSKEILDSLKDGFFTINHDLQIGATTSRACKELFKQNIGGKRIGKVLNLKDNAEEQFELILEQMFENILPLDVNLSLLPKKVETNDSRILGLYYTPILDLHENPEKIVVVASDITSTVLEQREMADRISLNQTLINILNNYESFNSFLVQYKEDLAKITIQKSEQVVLRILHTLKGNTAIFGLEKIAKRIHAMESELAEIDKKDFFNLAQKFDRELAGSMKQFLDNNKGVLHIDYDKKQIEHYKIEKFHIEHLYQIAEKIPQDLSDEMKTVLDFHKRDPIYLYTTVFMNTVRKLTEVLDKKIRLDIEGQDLRIDREKANDVIRNLVHLINNACDHGIESEIVRKEKGKSDIGNIFLRFNETPDLDLSIEICDDGKGIDTEKLLGKAIELKIWSEEEAKTKTQDEIYKLMFVDELSTTSEVSQVSGRGVGLSALKQAIDKAKGSIEITSKVDEGTTFHIKIPGVF